MNAAQMSLFVSEKLQGQREQGGYLHCGKKIGDLQIIHRILYCSTYMEVPYFLPTVYDVSTPRVVHLAWPLWSLFYSF